MGRKKEATLEDVRFEVSRVCSCLNMLDERLKKLVPKSNFPEIPPAWVLKAARANLDRTHSWPDYYSVLDDFYGLPHVGAQVDSSIKAGTLAVYRYATKTIYSRDKTMSDATAIHEYFHHLTHLLNISTSGEEGQQLADAFAQACLAAESDNKA